MILDKLVRQNIPGYGKLIYPLYQLFKERLKPIKFEHVNIIHGTHLEFKQRIKDSIKNEGLLCPMVVNKKNELINGNHRFKALQTLGDASLFYYADNQAEENFFSRLNVEVWKLHPNVESHQFMFEGKMKPYTEKCMHLFQNVKRVKL